MTKKKRPYIPKAIRQQVTQDARHRCGYCLTPVKFTAKQLHIEHIIPIAAGDNSTIENLWLACDLYNSYKGIKTYAIDPITNTILPLFNPRKQEWSQHFAWSKDGLRVLGTTTTGRATVRAL